MRVSIVTITYNAGPLFDKTAECVLAQTCPDFEYLVVDGASKDDTLERVGRFESRFAARGISMRVVSEPDRGIYDAMNKGLALAQGDYVWFLNAGDVADSPETLKQLLEGIPQGADPDFLYGETLIVDAEGRIMGQRRLKAPERLTWKSFRMGMLVCHQSMLVHRRIAPAYDLQYRYSSDFDWTIRCLKTAESVHNSRMVVSRFMDGGVSKKKMKASLKERFRIMAIHYGWAPTALRHIWFVLRAAWFKLLHGWI